jgi:dTDP-4-amino-4,6-dideoxygalactose transaminase
VLIPDATFWATFEAVVNVGAQVVTVDIDQDDLQMDFELFRRALDEQNPKAAILVHLYGWGSEKLADFRALCRERGVLLVEDGAQSFDVEWQGESIYRGAEISTVSFYPAKVLGACGDAGAVYCGTPELATRVRQLANHGRTGHYDHGLVGWNSRISGFDAAYLNLSLEYLPERLASRRRLAELYRRQLEGLGVETRGPGADYRENGYLNVCLFDPERRPALEAGLKAAGIGFGIVYPAPMSTQPGAAGHLAARYGGQNAEWLARSVLNLPLFAHMRDDELGEVLSALRGLV